MKNFKYTISNKVFDIFPTYIRGVIVISQLKNTETPENLLIDLKQIIDDFRKKVVSSENLAQMEDVILWRSAFKSLGFSSEYRPSFEALLRRIINNPDALRPISTLVDLGNLCSIKYHIPIGVHEIYENTEDVKLTISESNEIFIEFGKEEIEHPNKGEIILLDGENVLTRRWVWRQGKQSIITMDTRNIFINVDCLDKGDELVLHICNEIADLFIDYCGGQSVINLLKKDSNTLMVEI